MVPQSAQPPTAPGAAGPRDPYALDPGDIQEPPRTAGATLRRIGPGIILAAAIVGSGELIATTVLGAQVGYVALWVILLSCFIKPVVQAELGRYTVASGEPSLESFARLPGPARWAVWGWAAMVLMTQFQVGAMFAGVAQVMNLLVPSVPISGWVLIFAVVTLALLLGGGYERIEKLAMIKVGLFTLLTFLAAVLLVRRPDFDWGAIGSGLRFELPPAGIGQAVAVFAITGVGTGELFMYPYWCVEKGYARSAGPFDGSAAWTARARGWVRVMHVDIFASALIYTVATIAFYLLGAGILHQLGSPPVGVGMIKALSRIYTETLGGWALPVFYAGAIITLYGTIFAATAAHSRMYADMVRLFGAFRRDDYAARVRWRQRFVVVLTVVPVALYFLFGEPVAMVKWGGFAQAALLPVGVIGTLYLRHRHLPRELRPGRPTTVFLWVASVVIVAFVGYSIIASLRLVLA